MEDLVKLSKQFLSEIFGEETDTKPADSRNLPFFLLTYYDFYIAQIGSNTTILMFSKNQSAKTPNAIKKHLKLAQKHFKNTCVVVQATLSSYRRKRYVALQIPFLIPNNQLHIPTLGLVFRERCKNIDTTSTTHLSPATQAVVLYLILRHKADKCYFSELLQPLGYSAMTLSRVFRELQSADIGQIHREGKQKWWGYPGACIDFWNQIQPMLSSPIKRSIRLIPDQQFRKHLPKSGLSALSDYSLLSQPEIPVFAIDAKQHSMIIKDEWWEACGDEKGAIELELWSYDPGLLAKDHIADPLSVFLSLRDEQDERVAQALEEMMEKIEW